MADPTGGLARRAGYANEVAGNVQHPILHVDTGNYFQPPGPNSDLINALMTESLMRFPMQALNLTAGDLPYWSSELSRGNSEETHFISSNLLPLEKSHPAPEPFVVLSWPADEVGLEQDLRISFAGLAVPQRIRSNSGFQARDPVDAISGLGSGFWETELQVVLTDLSEEEVFRLLKARPQIDIVIRGERRFVLEEPKKIGDTWLLTAVERGRSLGQVDLAFDSTGKLLSLTASLIEMNSKIERDSYLADREKELLEKLP